MPSKGKKSHVFNTKKQKSPKARNANKATPSPKDSSDAVASDRDWPREMACEGRQAIASTTTVETNWEMSTVKECGRDSIASSATLKAGKVSPSIKTSSVSSRDSSISPRVERNAHKPSEAFVSSMNATRPSKNIGPLRKIVKGLRFIGVTSLFCSSKKAAKSKAPVSGPLDGTPPVLTPKEAAPNKTLIRRLFGGRSRTKNSVHIESPSMHTASEAPAARPENMTNSTIQNTNPSASSIQPPKTMQAAKFQLENTFLGTTSFVTFLDSLDPTIINNVFSKPTVVKAFTTCVVDEHEKMKADGAFNSSMAQITSAMAVSKWMNKMFFCRAKLGRVSLSEFLAKVEFDRFGNATDWQIWEAWKELAAKEKELFEGEVGGGNAERFAVRLVMHQG